MKKSGTAETAYLRFRLFASTRRWKRFFVGIIIFRFIWKEFFEMKKINVTDITLKKLCAERDVNLLFREKSAIANCADTIGADAVELPPVKSVREDTIIYRTVAQNLQNAVLAIPVGFNLEDINTAWECIKDAKKPRLQIELPVSTIQMEYTYHVKQAKMLEKIAELEDRIAFLEQEMYNEAYLTDHSKLTEISNELADCKEQLDETYMEWSELSE